jgi:hypothetical protein
VEGLGSTAKSLAVIANFGEQARSDLGSGPRQGTEQIMIGMRSEKLIDAPSIEPKLLFDRKKHLHQWSINGRHQLVRLATTMTPISPNLTYSAVPVP